MPELWGTKYTRAELRERLADLRQLADVRPFEFADGLERGTRGISIRNAAGLADCLSFSDPVADFPEQVFYHDLSADAEGRTEVSLVNTAFNGGQGLGLSLRYAKKQYPVFVEWKMMRAGTYVAGLEPSNCRVEGRAAERASGRLQFLQPGEVRRYAIEVEFFEPGRGAQ
jgi:hypothetical protein